MNYRPNHSHHDDAVFRKCGRSDLKMPTITLGLSHNFGDDVPFANAQMMCRCAFDQEITQFDVANNYKVPPGSAKMVSGRILRYDFSQHRDELFISTKVGYRMRPGP